MFDFNNPLDYDTFCLKVQQKLFEKPVTLLQLAFDFYDSNQDELISEFDAFKIMKFFGKSQIGELV